MENTEPEKEDLELKDIGQFYGSEGYRNIWMGVVGTDGND
jgi:2'-5' RNA ligase